MSWTLVWNMHSSGIYTCIVPFTNSLTFVQSAMAVLLTYGRFLSHQKKHIFLRLLARNRCLARDNLMMRCHVGDTTNLYCVEIETNNHVLFEYVLAKKN